MPQFCDSLREWRRFKLFRKVISHKCEAALNTEKASSDAFAVCVRTFHLMAHMDARPHLLRLRARAARTAVALDAARGQQKGTPLTSGGVGVSGPRSYKVRSGQGGAGISQPSGQVKGGHRLQVRGARIQTSCHASLRAPPVPSGTPRSLLRLLHPELPPRRETSAAGGHDQTGLEKVMRQRRSLIY